MASILAGVAQLHADQEQDALLRQNPEFNTIQYRTEGHIGNHPLTPTDARICVGSNICRSERSAEAHIEHRSSSRSVKWKRSPGLP